MTIEKLGRYEITGTLGGGTMGQVYRAKDPKLDRTVAIKTISLHLSKSELEDFEERFYREAKSAGGLNHPNIVTIHDVGESDGLAYIAIRETLDSGVVLPLQRVAELAAQVAEGLAYAHQHGVVHRDIKPANILITQNGLAKITDFGVALVPTGSRTVAGMVLGSPNYMSPEQVSGTPLDGRSDIFSLGVVIYEMLTGVQPFAADNISATLYRIVHDAPRPAHEINAGIPLALDKIVAKAIAKRPEDRYQSAAELAAKLRVIAGLGKPAKTDKSQPKPTDPAGEKRKASAADATMVVKPLRAAPTEGGKTDDAKSSTPSPRRGLWAALAILILLTMAWAGTTLFQEKPEPTAQGTQAPASPPKTVATAEQTPAPLPTPESPAPDTTPTPVSTPPTVPPHKVTAPTSRHEARKPSAEKPPEKAERQAKEDQPGELLFAIAPWGEIHVDGRKVGVAPPLTYLELPPGEHTVEILNTSMPPYRTTIELAPGQSVKIKHKFKG